MKRSEYTAFIFAHVALFIVFVWFGSLKLFDISPANPLVIDLFDTTLRHVMPFLSAQRFIFGLGIYEVLVGIFFIIPRMEKVAITMLIPHMIVTMLPLFLLPEMTWQSFLAPTLEGQYIIKNVVVIALAATVFADIGKKVRA